MRAKYNNFQQIMKNIYNYLNINVLKFTKIVKIFDYFIYLLYICIKKQHNTLKI